MPHAARARSHGSPGRRAFRRGIGDRQARRTLHRLFRDARTSHVVYDQASRTMQSLRDRPALTVFGSLGDYLRFQPRWGRLLPNVTQRVVPGGLHFPMCDDPALTARHIAEWHEAEFPGQA